MIAAFLDNSVPNRLPGAANSWVIHPPILIPLGAGLVFGMLNLVISPGIVMLTSLGIGFFWLIAKYPEYGILALVAYTSTVLNYEMVPLIKLGGASIHPSDLIIGWLLLVLLWRITVARDLRPRPTPLDLPILIMMGVCLFSTLRGIIGGDIPFNSGFRDLRHMINYLLYFPIIHLISDAAAQRRLWKGLLILASLTSLATVLQSVVGPSVPFLPGRVESLYTAGLFFDGIARVVPPGASLIFLFLILTGVAMGWGGGKGDTWRKFALMGLFAMGLLLTYYRNLWGGAVAALLAALLLVGLENRRRMIGRFLGGLTLSGFLLGSIYVAIPDSDLAKFLDATLSRAVSLFDSKTYKRGDRDINTMEMRAIEVEHALPHILPPKIFGIGVGSPYRPCLPMDSEVNCQLPKYIHNGPVAILVRLGLVGFLAYLWICITTLGYGFGRWRRASTTGDQIIVLGCTLTLTMVILCSLVDAYFLLPNWIPPIVVMLAAIMARTSEVRSSKPGMAGAMS